LQRTVAGRFQGAPVNKLPLNGCKVLDLTRALAGPFCTMILADLGAEVTKVEPLPEGDMSRLWGPFAEEEGMYHLSTNRNKKSIAIDLRNGRGLDLVKKMAVESDVLVENYKVGTTKQMGLDYEAVHTLNPKLIYGSITGFGRGGPYEMHPGFDQIAQGMSGLMSLTGIDSSSLRVGIPIADLVAGMWSAIGIISAILQRRSTDAGQQVETSLLAGLIGILTFQGQRYLTLGEVATSAGNDHPLLAPYGVFETKDGGINIAVGTEAIWAKFCRALELEHLIACPDYADNSSRRRHAVKLKARLEECLRTKTKQEWWDILARAGVPAGPINTIGEALSDPHVLETRRIESVDHPTIGPLRQLANPIQFSDAPGPLSRTPPPLLGEHSLEILSRLGLSQSEIGRLVTDGIVRDGRTAATACLERS
jgi:crotonobetainyl-CoA:carnitine CoA-transferase CaiB-like acyl-CoA transferase